MFATRVGIRSAGMRSRATMSVLCSTTVWSKSRTARRRHTLDVDVRLDSTRFCVGRSKDAQKKDEILTSFGWFVCAHDAMPKWQRSNEVKAGLTFKILEDIAGVHVFVVRRLMRRHCALAEPVVPRRCLYLDGRVEQLWQRTVNNEATRRTMRLTEHEEKEEETKYRRNTNCRDGTLAGFEAFETVVHPKIYIFKAIHAS